MKKKIASGIRHPQAPERALRQSDIPFLFLLNAEHALARHHLPRIAECLGRLSEKDIWWRPNPASNSAGNLMLHLAGNVRQWIIAGLGGEPDIRNRDREFQEQGPIPRRVLNKLTPADLLKIYSIQKFRVTGFHAISHVIEHFAYHSGQIIYLTKLRLGKDLGLTQLPGQKARRPSKSPRLPAI